MRPLISVVMLVLASCVIRTAHANGTACATPLAQEAEITVSALSDWGSVFSAYRKYQVCDDGAIAEGFTDSVVKLLGKGSASISELQEFVRKDHVFLKFVYRHITESADPDDLKAIVSSTRNCPPENRKLCVELRRRAQEAVRRL